VKDLGDALLLLSHETIYDYERKENSELWLWFDMIGETKNLSLKSKETNSKRSLRYSKVRN
jgi:hypothetical protein